MIFEYHINITKYLDFKMTNFQTRGFTNNPQDIQVALEDIAENRVCDMCDVGSVFDTM